MRIRIHRKVFPLLIVFTATLVTFFFVWTRIQNIRLNRELMRLYLQEKKIDIENKKLRVTWAQLSDPNRLRKIAQKKFQLKEASSKQILVIQEKNHE